MIFLFCTSHIRAQKKDSTYIGTVEGLVKDSTLNYVLSAATISIFKVADKSLIDYQLSDNSGKFFFYKLPVNIPLGLSVSYIGYQNVQTTFLISKETKQFKFKSLNLKKLDNNLKEVIINANPPMQMKGDTLEFNADVFKLDSNAVVEDLLRKLPGLTVWSDGLITFNGKPVKSVLVEGKPFFGGDPKIAIQNLPKNSVNKIQVYEDKSNADPIKPESTINIQLKSNKKTGLFGKIGVGYGSDERYTADGMISLFSPKIQASIVGGTNNNNRTPNNVNKLISLSSFKGIGNNTEYQSDFRMPGVNKFNAVGGLLKYEIDKNNLLDLDYLSNNIKNITLQTIDKITSINESEVLKEKSTNTLNKENSTYQSKIKYDFNSDKRDFLFQYSSNSSTNNSEVKQNTSSLYELSGLKSMRILTETEVGNHEVLTINAGYHNKAVFNNKSGVNHKQHEYLIDYSFSGLSGQNEIEKMTAFIGADPVKNQFFRRSYAKEFKQSSHYINGAYYDLLKIFGINRSPFSVNLTNVLGFDAKRVSLEVNDFDTLQNKKNFNKYLSNNTIYKTTTEKPILNLGKSFLKHLSNRYKKTWNINLGLGAELFNQTNVSDKEFQKFDKSFVHFLPSATIGYNNTHFGDHESLYSARYSTSVIYPLPDQYTPLIDSAIIWQIRKGNLSLKPSYQHNFVFSFDNTLIRTKNFFSYGLKLSTSYVKNYMTDSSNYDSLGRSINYTVNASGYTNLNLSITLSKAFRFKSNQIQIRYIGITNQTSSPSYINNEFIKSSNFMGSNTFSVDYSYKDLFNLSFDQGYDIATIRQQNSGGNKFKNSSFTSNVSASVNVFNSLTLASNIGHTKSESNYAKPIIYAIWNSSITYRFLKGKEGEIKFSALDLLRQNTSIRNYSTSNSIATSTLNVLQYYYMITLSYFPRRFDTKKK